MKLMITCRQATDFISKKEEGKLSLAQSIQLIYHLFICSFCKLFYRQNKIITKETGNLHKHDEASLTQPQKQEMITAINNEIQ